MGWKTRKDKLQSEVSSSDRPDQTDQETPDGTIRYDDDAEGAGGRPREPYVMDLNDDAFRTNTNQTSLDPGAFSWYQATPIVRGDEPDAPPAARPAPPAANGGNPAQRQPTAPIDDDFGVFAAPHQTAPSRNPGAPANRPPASPGDWTLTPAEELPPLTLESLMPQQTGYQPETQPAFSDPNPTPARPIAPSAAGMPSIEQLMSPKAYEAPPADPNVGSVTPPVPESYRPSPAQTYQPPQTYQPQHQPAGPQYAANMQSRAEREGVAPGLVRQEGDLGIPRVAPFILDMGSAAEAQDPIEQPTLVIRFKNLAARYTITKDVITLGRPDSDTGNYPDVEIEMDEGVSRKHAEIRRRGSRYCLIDLGSTNGTLLNGKAVIALTESELTHGDRIRIGEMTEIVFE